MRKIFAGAKHLRPTHILLALIAALLWLVWRKAEDAHYFATEACNDAYDAQIHLTFGRYPDEHDEEAFGSLEAQQRIRDLEVKMAASTVLHEEANRLITALLEEARLNENSFVSRVRLACSLSCTTPSGDTPACSPSSSSSPMPSPLG